MVRSAAQLTPALQKEVERLARQPLLIAEINRLVGELAERRGQVRPSYARVRQLVLVVRDRAWEPSWGRLLLDVDLRVRPPDVLLDKAAGTLPRPEDAGVRRLR
jgi:hypothetical protein